MKKTILAAVVALNMTFAGQVFAEATATTTATETAVNTEKQNYLIAKKTSLYIKATNAFGSGPLDGTSSWPAKEKKVAEGIKKKDFRVVESFLYFSSRGSKNLRDNLQKALDDKDVALPAIDGKAQQLVEVLDKLVPVWEKLEQYNKTSKFEDDNGAQGKELMEIFTPAYDEMMKLYNELSPEVSKAAEELRKQRMESYKQQGRLLELYSEESLDLARNILGLFNSAKDFKDKAKIDAANAMLTELETKLEEQMKAYTEAETAGKKPSSYYKTINSELINFTGDYRKARKSPNTWASHMVNDFNRAVQAYNNIR